MTTTPKKDSLRDGRYFIVGGAGFMGSHFVDALLGESQAARVTIYDNFSSGREWHYQAHREDSRFHVVRGEVEDLDTLADAMAGHDTVIHCASNPDIARASTDPAIDFVQGTALTHFVLEAMRLSRAKTILYASGSGVYGDLGSTYADEDHGPLEPISTYGASKLAGEALISSYCHLFGVTGRAFRFGNVVGPRQTHGVGFDFILRLRQDPSRLRILGDGMQSKSYIHVFDVVRAVMLAHQKTELPFRVYNVATEDYVTVLEIAEIAVSCLGLLRHTVQFEFTGGERGWKGDVPIVRLSTGRIHSLGWRCRMTSRQALRSSMQAILEEPRLACQMNVTA